MMPFGPQAGSGFLSPTPQRPMGGDPMADWSMQNQAQQQAIMHGMRGMLNQQYRASGQGAAMVGAGLNKNALSGFRPAGPALKPAASSFAGQSYNVGGPTTLGATSANSAGLTGEAAAANTATNAASQSATQAAASSAGPSLGSLASGAVALAGAGYAAYEGLNSAKESLRRMQEALSYGLQPGQEAELRQGTFNSGMQSALIGSHAGGLGGLSYGPYGAAAGAVLGGAGGARQAWDSYDTNPERFQAQLDFQKNPFKG